MARTWHVVTAAVTTFALALQTWLVVVGESVLAEGEPPGLGLRLVRLVAYFTIQSNLLVAVSTAMLARAPDRDGEAFRVLRLAGLVGITVTGVVHWVALRPLLDLEGASRVADKLLHVVVPLLAVAGWLAFGPRPRVTWTTVARALAWPLAWVVVILAQGAATGWFPYPFLDVDAEGWPRVLVACAVVTAVVLACLAGARVLDRRLAPAPRSAGGG